MSRNGAVVVQEQTTNTRENSWMSDGGKVDVEVLKERVEYCSKLLASVHSSDVLNGGKHFYDLIIAVWSLDTSLAIDAAELVCETIRENGGLDSMLNVLCTGDVALHLQVSQGLEQIMISANRHFIARHDHFNSLVRVACSQASLETIQCGTGILENLFKDSMETCLRLILHGEALEGVLLGCRSSDFIVLQHSAAALANCSMYGGPKCQMKMVAKHADQWLFPLAFSKDNVVKYYALLAICCLASNTRLENKVATSGTLDLVLPFLQSQDPEEFCKVCPNHSHGQSADWLMNLVPLLICGNEEARSLSAFHFAMEAAIKKKQHRLQVFKDIDVIGHLQESAKIGSQLTARFCIQALTTYGASLPAYQCWDVLSWSPTHVGAWVKDLGRQGHASAFIEHFVTGNILLDLTLEDLKEVGITSQLQGRWFLKEVERLRWLADVSGQDHDDISKWLTGVSKHLTVYKVDFIRHGVNKSLLPYLTDDLLQSIGISKPLDRLKLLLAVEALPPSKNDVPDSGHPLQHHVTAPAHHSDVFISYRRHNGSQLASLLKVHLQVRGLSAFLDVEELGGGKFDDAILSTIIHSSNMLLVLSPGALDRCRGDNSMQDWVHREITCALDHKVQVIPIMTPKFQWPNKTELPEDLQQVCTLNGVSWSHEYQDACVEKIISFLHLPRTTLTRNKSRAYSLH